MIARKTTGFIKDSVTNFPNQPFFAYVAPYVPHSPATPPPRYAHRFAGAKAPRTASFNEVDVGDKPAWVRNKARLTRSQIDDIDDFYRKRLQTLLAVGDLVSDIIDTLTATGQLDNTYIFFSSDNGFHQGQHRLNSGKNTAYDEDIAVPLLVRGPGVPEGQVVTEITANVDYASTWAAIAGVAVPSFVDGRSLLPFLRGATPSAWRKALLLEHAGPSITLPSDDPLLEPPDAFDIQAVASGGAPIFAGLRTAENTYVEYDNGERELYNLATDPAELDNAYSTANPALKTNLSQWLGSLRSASGSTLRSAEASPP